MYVIKRADGKAHSLFGWTYPEFAMQYRSEEEAEAARRRSPALASCTVERVIPKPDPGSDGFVNPSRSAMR